MAKNNNYVSYVNVNNYDYPESETIVEFGNIKDLDDLIQLLLNNGFNNYCHKVYTLKIGNNYYLNCYDREIDIINRIIQTL